MGADGNDAYRGGPGTSLVFCCSGAADVGEIGHRAARLLDDRGVASRFCLAGIGGGVEAMLRKTRQATSVLAIDGCKVGCARRTLERAGFAHVVHVCLGDLGIEKGRSPVTDDRIERVFDQCVRLLTQNKEAS